MHLNFWIDNLAATTNYPQDYVSFTLKDLPLTASGMKSCDTPIVKGSKRVQTYLHVVPRRSLPVIHHESMLRLPMGHTTELLCTSSGEVPEPILRLVDGEGNSLNSENSFGTGKHNITTTLYLTMTPELVGTSYRCIADYYEYPDLPIQESPYFVYLFNTMEAGKTVTGMKCPTLPEAGEELKKIRAVAT